MPAMRVGLAHVPRFPAEDSVALMRDAEAWGYDDAWLCDQPLYRDPYAMLMAVGPATSTIRLGIGVTNPFSQHPVMTARLAGTVAEVLGPRFVLGVGTGNRREFVLPLGHRGDRAPERCRDAVRVIRALLGGERTHYRSELFVADGTKLSFPTRADVPLYVAGVGPRILEVAGEVADGIIVNAASAPGIASALQHVRRGAARAGRPAADGREVIAWAIAIVTDDKAAGYDRLRPMIAHTMAPFTAATLEAVGVSGEQGRVIRETYWAEGQAKAATHVTDRMIDNWAWVGPPDELADRFLALREAGASTVVFVPWSTDLEETRTMGRRVAERALVRLG
jgi:5,10-methylenetetrahydromethanopterin reductase